MNDLSSKGASNLPPEQMTAATTFCRACGHSREQHWMGLGQPGTCSATVDLRPVGAGGSSLSPCGCKGFLSPQLEPKS